MVLSSLLKTGANTAWVPSPTAAPLLASGYHQVDVFKVPRELLTGKAIKSEAERAAVLNSLLPASAAKEAIWSPAARQAEIDNNAQGI